MTDQYIPRSCIEDNLKGSLAVVYDFAVNGGAVGTIELPGNIPNNAVITSAFVDVLTDPTSGGSATVAIGIGASNTAILGATAIASVTGVLNAKASAGVFKQVLGGNPTVTIATAALTAGKMAIVINWVGSFDDVETVTT